MPARQASPSATLRRLNLSTREYQTPLAICKFGLDRISGIESALILLILLILSVSLAMLDIRLIREQPDFVKSRLATRGGDDAAKIDEVLRADAERRKAETALQQLNGDRKRLSKEIGGKRAKGEATEEIEARVREIGDQISLLNEQTAEADEQQKDLLLGIPNLPQANVP